MIKDKYKFNGFFKIKMIHADGTVDIYEDKNLIMDNARKNMAETISGVTAELSTINKLVIGSLGHINDNILDPVEVGENRIPGDDTSEFNNERTKLYSEESGSGAYNYRITFDVNGTADETDSTAVGIMYTGDFEGTTDGTPNTVRRELDGTTVTYTITIPVENANSGDVLNPAIAYTEAALYAGDDIFSMKTFNGRVKESTVSMEITWSIIF